MVWSAYESASDYCIFHSARLLAEKISYKTGLNPETYGGQMRLSQLVDKSIDKTWDSKGRSLDFPDFFNSLGRTNASACFYRIDLQYKCNTKKIMTQKATRDIMGVTTQP